MEMLIKAHIIGIRDEILDVLGGEETVCVIIQSYWMDHWKVGVDRGNFEFRYQIVWKEEVIGGNLKEIRRWLYNHPLRLRISDE